MDLCKKIIEINTKLFTARDRTLMQVFKNPKKPSFNFGKDSVVFFAGPSGINKDTLSIGPTTSYRMEPFIPSLLENGVKYFIGKGEISNKTKMIIEKKGGFYFQAFGGLGAFYGKKIVSIEPVFLEELGPEAIFEIVVNDFPVLVSICGEKRILLNHKEIV